MQRLWNTADVESASATLMPMAMLLGGMLLVAGFPARSIAEDAGEAPGENSSVRDQLIQRWDLNADGRIDEMEAEVARSRMRSERIEMRSRSERQQIDPLTGRPRGEAADVGPTEPPDLLLVPGSPVDNHSSNAAAGMRAQRPVPSATARPGGARPDTAGTGSGQRDGGRPEEGPSKAGRLNAGRPRARPGAEDGSTGMPASPIMTGGSRANAPAVRPGYGASGPKVDLNAGRLPAGLPASRGLPPRGGFVPTRPGSGPSAAIPPRTGMRPMAPPSTAPRPRLSAEDIGGP